MDAETRNDTEGRRLRRPGRGWDSALKPILVEARSAAFSYGARTVLEDVSLAFERSLVYAVVGPTGCGKTTLLHLLAGLAAPRAGSITFACPEDARRVALIPQDYGLFPWKTVRQNAVMGIEIQHKAAAERRVATARCDAILKELRIGELADRWPSSLSGGQKQRVAIARALAVDPALLLMDEPFSALDADIREGLQDLLKELPRRYGATPIIVTHDIAEALRVADRLVVFRRGKGSSAAFTTEMLANSPGLRTEMESKLRDYLRNARERSDERICSESEIAHAE
jgi:ABC-type nitrate/sulfonate/bicarbonate transport system ATPase subunit